MYLFGSASTEFVFLVESLGLQDLLLMGSEFTFSESGSGVARSRLDRFLVRNDDSSWWTGRFSRL